MKNRILSVLVCVSMMLSISAPVLAAELDVEQAEPQIEALGCTECGMTEGHAETCIQYVAPVIACAECGGVGTHTDGCSVAPVSTAVEVCDTCGEENCVCCGICGSYPCVCEKEENCVECGMVEGHADICSKYMVPYVGCTECGMAEGHEETCSQYVVPKKEITVYESLLSAATIEELFAIMTATENYSSVMALSATEIEVLAMVAESLPTATGDEEYRTLVLETLAYLPNSTLSPCADCDKVNGHEEWCPVLQTEVLLQGNVFPDDGYLASTTYTLPNNTTLTTNLTVGSGVSATIDLNGMVLRGNGSGFVININSGGSLQIIDSQPTLSHYGNITAEGLWVQADGNYNDQSKGGIITHDGKGRGINVAGSLTMTGGMIAGCKGNPGPAITASSTGSVTLNGTKIIYNVSAGTGNVSGGAIHGEPSHNNTGSCLNLTNVTVANNRSNTLGGGIYGYNVTLTSCTIEGNSAATGGGIYLTDSGDSLADASLTVVGGTISNNVSGGHGGGIFGNTDSRISISGGALISGNEAANRGGGIYGEYIATTGTEMAKVLISGNDALNAHGGGIYVTKKCEITYSKIDNNYASACGGGIFSNCDLTITDSEITNNRAMSAETGNHVVNLGRGGGIYATGGTDANCTLTRTNVTGNASMYYGGGVQICNGATLELLSGKISNNEAILTGAGGVHVTDNATLTLTGGEISGNIAHTVGGGIHSSYTCTLKLNGGSITGNIVYGRGGGVHVNTGGNLQLNGTNISGNKAYNGPARITATIDRENRTWDIGPIENDSVTPGYGGGVLVNAGTCTMKKGTLSDNYAQGGGGGIALLMSGLSVNDSHFADCQVVAFTLSGGTVSGNTTDGNGAAVYLMRNMLSKAELGDDAEKSLEGTPTVTATGGTVTGNTATGNGGAVYQETGTKFVISGTASFLNNTAHEDGGAVYIAQGTAEINGGTISNNTAYGSGGALFVGGAVTMTIGIVNNNTASGNGGALYVAGGSFTMENGTVNGNTAANGGAAYINDGGFTMYCGTIDGNKATSPTSYGGAVHTNGGDIVIGVVNCTGADDSKHTPYLNGGTTATHPIVQNNTAVFGGGLAVTDGVVNIYCCKIMENHSDNAGTGQNVFMEDTDPDDDKTGTLDIYEGATIGGNSDHGIVVIGGNFTVHTSVEGKEVTIRYYPNYHVLAGIGKNGEPWTGKAPDQYNLNLPYCPNNWITEQGDENLAFVGWTDRAPEGGNTTVALNFIRDKSHYTAVGEAVQIVADEAKYVDGVYYMDFYAVWAPLTSTISYQYALLPYHAELDDVTLKSLDSVYDAEMLGTLSSTTTGFTVTGTMIGTYDFYTDGSVSTSYSVNLPTVSRDQYEFKGWALYADTGSISNWGTDPDITPTVTGGEYKWGNINHLVSKTVDYDLLYQNAFTVNRNFGNITLVAVFERTHADMTVQNSGSGLSDTQGTIYSIRGTAAKSGQSVSLTVAIVGDDSVTIKDLPVGVYTVTEQNAWTWRYDVSAVTDSDPASAATTAAGTITVDGNSTHEVTFSNYDLTSNKWLSINHALLPAGTYSLKKKQS